MLAPGFFFSRAFLMDACPSSAINRFACQDASSGAMR